MLKKIVYFFIGILLAVILVALGFLLTNLIEHGIAIIISVVAIPLTGYFLYKSSNKFIGLGMLVSTLPIVLLSLFFAWLSQMH